jgi:serine/threonine protein kinase
MQTSPCVSRSFAGAQHCCTGTQVILNKKGDTYDGKQSDVWSSGVMLFVTLVGQYPFERPEDKGDPQKMHRMIRRIVNVDYKLPSRVDVSADCKVELMPLAFMFSQLFHSSNRETHA